MSEENVVNTVEMLNHLRDALSIAESFNANLNMESWIYSEYDKDFRGADTIKQAASCGTTCCNAGWAGLHAPLQELGLKTTITFKGLINRFGVLSPEVDETFTLHGNGDFGIIENDYENNLAKFFGITDDEAVALFSDDDWEANGMREELVPSILGLSDDDDGPQLGDYMTLGKSIKMVDALITRYS